MSNTKRFILLGDAGVGKSTLINILYNYSYGTRDADKIFCESPKLKLAIPCANWPDCLDQKFENQHSERDINDQTQSQTQICTSYSFETGNIHLQIIDTPGFSDTNGTNVDEQNLANIEKALKEIPSLNGIIVVVNGSVPRIGVSFKNFLHLLHQVWPNDLLDNCVAILTNCDELSVNLDASVLRRDLNVDDSRKFHLQNSLFRWDRKNKSPKTICRFKQDFEDNSETIKNLLQRLLQFNDVSTEAFNTGASKILAIEECIFRSVHDMVGLVQSYNQQQVAQDGIEAARHTMQSNKEWDKHREINVIRWVEVPTLRSTSSVQSKPKSTQQSSPSGQSVPSSSRSPSKDGDQHKSKSCDSGKNSPSQSTASQKVNTYSSVDDSRKKSEQPTAASPSSKTGGSYSITAAGEKYDKFNLSTLPSGSPQQRDRSSTSSPGNSANYPNSHKNAPHEPVYRQQQTKIQVTIPDNEAQSHHAYAKQQESTLQNRKQNLIDEQKVLSTSMVSLLQELKKQVAQLRSIYKNYDIIERNRKLLITFKERIKWLGDDCEMKRYYDETVNILSNK